MKLTIDIEDIGIKTFATLKFETKLLCFRINDPHQYHPRDKWIMFLQSIGNMFCQITFPGTCAIISCTAREIDFIMTSDDGNITMSYSYNDLNKFKEFVQEIIDIGDENYLWD